MSEEFTYKACANCRYWHMTDDADGTITPTASSGECRVRSVPIFPSRDGSEWCGEFKPEESANPEDIADGLLDEELSTPPAHSRLNKSLEPTDVVLFDNLGGYRGVTGIVAVVTQVDPNKESPDDEIAVNIAGTIYKYPRSKVTARVGRVSSARANDDPEA